MSPDNGKSSDSWVVIALFTGLAVGAIIGILFAPKSGKEIRNDLKEKSEKLLEAGKESVSEVVEKTKDFIEAGKQKIEELKDIVK